MGVQVEPEYAILFLHLSQYSVGRGIGGNLQVFTDVMPV